ncbi:rRNA pseudouridine synthase, partial [Candidatus Woesearchaeota archaeon]|nr:rRNA pseudouridine synthase [Candidatus Woesearchaeota archaeon]
MERVQKILSNAGYCSRRKAEEYIKNGRVRVNGKVITIGDQAGPEDKIYVDGKKLHRDEKVYLLFHKPTGYVTASTDKHERTIMEFIRTKERVYPVGRLDKDTSGLIFLTNDGDWANSIAHPRYEVTKTYEVETDRKVETEDLQKINKGVRLEDGKAKARTRRLKRGLEITLHDGKNRIIRRMFEELGYEVLSLHRTKIGNIGLGRLKVGKY